MKSLAVLALAALAASVGGCATTQGAAVDYVFTRTPGVVFVVVHPTQLERKQYPTQTDGPGNTVDPRAEYVLLCDARTGDGMHCEVATEAGARRFSYTPHTTASGPTIELPVGSIPDGIQKVEPAPVAAPVPPPPPPTPPPPPPPPAPGGKKQ